MKKKIKLLFQGDSITHGFRNEEDCHDLGIRYVKFAAALIKDAYPDVEFEFINLGVCGNKVHNLADRLERDFIEIQPDIVSILAGANDVWHHADDRSWIPNEKFENSYRTILEGLRTCTNAKIMIMEPFLIPIEDKKFFREDLNFKIDVIRELALEYADVFLPTDGILWSEYICDDPLSYSYDGIHLTEKGAEFVGRKYFEYISPIIDSLVK
ncbi:MAG: GDSL family lipase [Clostridia bacterium]|nr:GDSL family lipase [Clostridia bacterium]